MIYIITKKRFEFEKYGRSHRGELPYFCRFLFWFVCHNKSLSPFRSIQRYFRFRRPHSGSPFQAESDFGRFSLLSYRNGAISGDAAIRISCACHCQTDCPSSLRVGKLRKTSQRIVVENSGWVSALSRSCVMVIETSSLQS